MKINVGGGKHCMDGCFLQETHGQKGNRSILSYQIVREGAKNIFGVEHFQIQIYCFYKQKNGGGGIIYFWIFGNVGFF